MRRFRQPSVENYESLSQQLNFLLPDYTYHPPPTKMQPSSGIHPDHKQF